MITKCTRVEKTNLYRAKYSKKIVRNIRISNHQQRRLKEVGLADKLAPLISKNHQAYLLIFARHGTELIPIRQRSMNEDFSLELLYRAMFKQDNTMPHPARPVPYNINEVNIYILE